MTLKQIERSGIEAVRMLRVTKLSVGLPFMINSSLLPSEQCYMEYPDGSIKIVTISKHDNGFKVIDELDSERTNFIRNKYKLF